MKPDTNNSEQREQLLLTMQGHPSKKGGVPVSLFAAAYLALAQLMGKSAERLAGKGNGAELEFVVAKLSHSSPLQAGIEAAPSLPHLWDGDLAHKAIVRTEELLRAIDAGAGDDTPTAELDIIEDMTKPLLEKRGRVSMMKIQRLNGRAPPHPTVDITSQFVDNLKRIREAEIRGITTVVGVVEGLNLHLTPSNPFYQLWVYPDIGTRVKFQLHPKDKDKALQAIGKRAAITGEARYRPDTAHPLIQRPHRIDEVTHLEIFDEPGPDSPKLSDFRGAFPNLTGGKDTLEYLRELRGED